MFRDLVRRLLAAYDIEVVEADQGTPFRRAIDEANASFLIVGNGDDHLPAACTELVVTRPDVRALAVIDDGRRGLLFELLDNLSPETLASAVHAELRGAH